MSGQVFKDHLENPVCSINIKMEVTKDLKVPALILRSTIPISIHSQIHSMKNCNHNPIIKVMAEETKLQLPVGKKNALKKYDQFTLKTSCF